jgi:hypothetical protein
MPETENPFMEVSLYITLTLYSETSIHRFRQGSEKEMMDPGKQ